MSKQKIYPLLALATLSAGSLQAYEVPLTFLGTNMPPLDFHGFASQGYLASSDYNYLANNTRDGSFKFSEAGLNMAVNPFPRTRIAIQAFTYDVGDAGKYDVVLDYASAEYTFNDYFGVRAGRIRRPEGIYNDIQDVDVARTYVLLPQGMYNARWRDFFVSVDGGEVFGTIPMGKAGSLGYQLYYGLQRPQLDGGLAIQKENLPPYQKLDYFNSPQLGGGQLWWNTPLEGFRVGAALNYDNDLTFRTVGSPGVQAEGSPFTQHYSLEYDWRKWTFQAEYYNSAVDYDITADGHHITTAKIHPDSWYIGAAYRFNKWFETGVYYSEYYADLTHRGGIQPTPSDGFQKDAALSFRFDPTSWWTLKVEGHCIHGTAQLSDNVDNPVRDDNIWFMLALKSTFSF
jgi:hypothetical protein